MVGFGSYRRPFGMDVSPRAQMVDTPFGCFLMIAVPVLFLISTYWAFRDVEFLLQGETTTATVRDVQAVRAGRRATGRKVLRVSYSFKDAATGDERNEVDRVSLSWPRPGATVDVEYIPGDNGMSRLAGNSSPLSVIFFVVCTITALVYGVLLYREARKAVGESEKMERARRRDDS